MDDRRFAVWEVAALATCFALGATGLFGLQAYSTRSGTIVPVASTAGEVVNGGGPYHLVMYVHPRCPCTRASVSELRRIVDFSPAELDVDVISIEPPGASQDWRVTPILSAAAAIPGVRVEHASSPAEASAAGATTSGYVVLRDVSGRELFRGGITRGRSHEGANEGSSAVLQLLAGAADVPRQHAVYGCSLFDPESNYAGPAVSKSTIP